MQNSWMLWHSVSILNNNSTVCLTMASKMKETGNITKKFINNAQDGPEAGSFTVLT